MAALSKQTKMIVDGDVAEHLDANEDRRPDLDDIAVSWRGSYGYLTAIFLDGERTKLARIGDTGDDNAREFALYDPATETYTPAMLRTGQPTGHPQ